MFKKLEDYNSAIKSCKAYKLYEYVDWKKIDFVQKLQTSGLHWSQNGYRCPYCRRFASSVSRLLESLFH